MTLNGAEMTQEWTWTGSGSGLELDNKFLLTSDIGIVSYVGLSITDGIKRGKKADSGSFRRLHPPPAGHSLQEDP